MRGYVFGQFQKRWMAEDLEELHEISEQWEATFASPWALLLEPLGSEAELSSPSGPLAVVAAFQLRDAAVFEGHLARLASKAGSGVSEANDATYELDGALLPLALVHLLERVKLRVAHGFLLMSDREEGLNQIVRGWGEREVLVDRLDYQRLRHALPERSEGLLFIDASSVIRRGQAALEHPLMVAALWLGSRGERDTSLRLPSMDVPGDEALVPTIATWQATEEGGYRQSSTGTLSPVQWLLGARAIMGVIDETFLHEASVPSDDEAFEAPGIEVELLQMIDP